MKQRVFWKQYATDLYEIEKKRQWEEDVMAQTCREFSNICLGITVGLVVTVAVVGVFVYWIL